MAKPTNSLKECSIRVYCLLSRLEKQNFILINPNSPSILSRGWGLFLSLMEYKLSRRGGRLVRVNPRNTSRTCSACGHAENADANAARNILRAGKARSACSEAKTSESAA